MTSFSPHYRRGGPPPPSLNTGAAAWGWRQQPSGEPGIGDLVVGPTAPDLSRFFCSFKKMFVVHVNMAHHKAKPLAVNWLSPSVNFFLPCAMKNARQKLFVMRHDIRCLCRAKALLCIFFPFPAHGKHHVSRGVRSDDNRLLLEKGRSCKCFLY
jgi:hypothetical protein